MKELLAESDKIFLDKYGKDVFFGRCIFLSWYCERGTCKFCFRATTHHKIKHANKARRSKASILTDAFFGKMLGWPVEFLTGGFGIFEFDEIVEIAKGVSEIYGNKIWVNLGLLEKEQMEQLKPYVEGICASIETVEPNLHNDICPDKPIEPYEDMLDLAGEMGFKKSMTVVIGLEEKREDIELLFDFIEKHNLDQVTFYALKPVQGSPYKESPAPDYYAWWIAKTRIRFPDLRIVAGLTPKNPDYTKIILQAGANSITKFPVLKKFNTEDTRYIEKMVEEAGRNFTSNLTKLPDIDFMAEVDKLPFDSEIKEQMKIKVEQYLKRMR